MQGDGSTFDQGGESITAAEFAKSFGEDIARTLDVRNWSVGGDLSRAIDRIEAEVNDAIRREAALVGTIRNDLFPRLRSRKNAPKLAGKHAATRDELEAIHKGLLFNGGVEACDGALHVNDTMALTIYQLGVTLVSYRGNHGSWTQRLFRRDLRQACTDPIDEVLAILEKRNVRGGERTEEMGEMIQRSMLAYAERAILTERSEAVWRMGHGNPVPYELLTGGGSIELMQAAINTMRKLIESHQRFLFVAKAPTQRHLLTIGQALQPWEFAVVATLEETVDNWLHQLRFATGAEANRTLPWDGEQLQAKRWIPRFIREVASKVVVGVFRASTLAPAQVFFAHVDHADVAGRIAIADGMFQEHSGKPLLIDIARQVGDTIFGDSLNALAQASYGAAGVAWQRTQFPSR